MDENSGEDERDPAGVVGLDAYSSDNQFIGRVAGLLPAELDNTAEVQQIHSDTIDADGHLIGSRHLLIDGAGTIVQSALVVTVNTLHVDLAARRVTVPLTVTEIEALPQHNPHHPEVIEPSI